MMNYYAFFHFRCHKGMYKQRYYSSHLEAVLFELCSFFIITNSLVVNQ